MKKLILVLITFIITFFSIIYNIKIENVTNDTITLNIYGFNYIYNYN